MFMFFMAPPPAGGQQDPMSQITGMLVPFGAVIAIFYFMMIRPQQKRAKEHKKMIDSLKKGDKVITAAGIHGVVQDLDEKTVTLTIATNTHVTFDRSVITSINPS